MISLSSTRKGQTCLQTTYLDILAYNRNKKWPHHLSPKEINQHLELTKKMFRDKYCLLWVWLTDYNYPQTALM